MDLRVRNNIWRRCSTQVAVIVRFYTLRSWFHPLANVYTMNAVHVALLCSIPIFAVAPSLKEAAISLLKPSYLTTVYEGDGILVGDTAVSLPWWLNWAFTTINWKITQRPAFIDAPHSISLYVVSKTLAPRLLYRFDSNFTSDYYYVEGDFESVYHDKQHLDLRSNVYLLPKEYTPVREAKASIVVDVKRASESSSKHVRNETYGSTTCQFQDRESFRNFVDMEPGAIEYSTACHSMYGDCPTPEEDDLESFSSRAPSPFFTSTQLQQSYSSFSSIVPTQTFVKFEADITMYFYRLENVTNIVEYKCKIRGTDTCEFTTTQSWYNHEDQLVLAYIHPRPGPFSKTSTLLVTTDVLLLRNAAHLLVYLLIPSLLIRMLFF